MILYNNSSDGGDSSDSIEGNDISDRSDISDNNKIVKKYYLRLRIFCVKQRKNCNKNIIDKKVVTKNKQFGITNLCRKKIAPQFCYCFLLPNNSCDNQSLYLFFPQQSFYSNKKLVTKKCCDK